MSVANLMIIRGISTTSCSLGKRNFRKFQILNKRGTRIFKQQQVENPRDDYPVDSEFNLCICCTL